MTLRAPTRPLALGLTLACGVLACAFGSGCARRREPAPTAPAPSVAPAAPAPLDVGRVLAILTEHAPSVEPSVQVRGADIVVELRGHGGPAVALALLASLPDRLPGARASRLQLDASAWSATLATATDARASAVGIDGVALTTALAAARPVFLGDGALLASGVVDVTAAHIAFTGALAPGRTIGDAAGAIASGYTLTRVEAGPPFVLDITPSTPR